MEQLKGLPNSKTVFSDNEDIVDPYINTVRSTHEYIHEPYWRVVFSDDRLVYSSPNRRSWLELKSWLERNVPIYIKELSFGFRDHLELIHQGKADYFFVHSMLAFYDGPTQFYYIGGYRDGDGVVAKKYRIPEVYLVEEERRSLDDISVKRGLISATF